MPLRPQAEPSQPRPRRASGLLFTVIGVTLGLAIFVGSRAILREYGAMIGIPAYVAASLLFLLIAAVIRRGKRMRAPAADTVLATDTRPPVLYLRPFEVDGSMLVEQFFMQWSYEEQLARALKKIGPVIAVGSPQDDARMPELGAARMYLRDEAWPQRVDTLIRTASLVVLHAGTSPGLTWELRRVVEWNRPDRLIICLPIDRSFTPRKQRTAEARYAQFRDATRDIFPYSLPATCDGCAFLYFLPDWTPRLLQFNRPPTVSSETQSRALSLLSRQFGHTVARA